jgi:hypothetical protein
MKHKPIDERTRILMLLDEGIILQAEAAQLAGVSRQRIHQWVASAKLDPARARERYLKELWRDANS